MFSMTAFICIHLLSNSEKSFLTAQSNQSSKDLSDLLREDIKKQAKQDGPSLESSSYLDMTEISWSFRP